MATAPPPPNWLSCSPSRVQILYVEQEQLGNPVDSVPEQRPHGAAYE